MTFSATTILVLVLIVALLAGLAAWAYSTANRLDRLHVRSDLSWQALDAALARRAVVARAVASAMVPTGHAFGTSGPGGSDGRHLVALADRAERTDRTGREQAENQLSSALSAVPTEVLAPQLVAELADAEAMVIFSFLFFFIYLFFLNHFGTTLCTCPTHFPSLNFAHVLFCLCVVFLLFLGIICCPSPPQA